MNADQRPDSAQDGRIQRIMHIEDDEPVAELMKELLERKGYAVESFRCPTQALAAFSAQPGAYDLIVTDMNMPALDGIELARKLRDLRREVPIVLLSGWVGPEEQMMAQAAGLNGVLLKSIDVHELTEALHRTCLTLAIGGAGRLQN